MSELFRGHIVWCPNDGMGPAKWITVSPAEFTTTGRIINSKAAKATERRAGIENKQRGDNAQGWRKKEQKRAQSRQMRQSRQIRQ